MLVSKPAANYRARFLRETQPFGIIRAMKRAPSPEIEKLQREYNDLTARLQRGTSPNLQLDQDRLRQLVSEIDRLQKELAGAYGDRPSEGFAAAIRQFGARLRGSS